MSAASGHGSAFEESLKDDSDRESLFSASSPSGRNDSEMGSTFQGMPGAFQSHAFQEPESPVPTPSPSSNIPATTTTDGHKDSNTTKDSETGFVNKVFPSVVREELTNQPSVANKDRSSRRRSGKLGEKKREEKIYVTYRKLIALSFSLIHVIEVLFDMTGYKTDSGSESSDSDDLPRGILSDSERHHRGLRKRFSRKSNLSKEQRQQLLEDIRQGNFLKPEESLAATQVERQGKD